jgi:hypothetical protein
MLMKLSLLKVLNVTFKEGDVASLASTRYTHVRIVFVL